MATIKPFCGIRYNPAQFPDLSPVISQPYDRISAAQRQQYFQLSPYNIARIITTTRGARDAGENDVYERSRALLEQWKRERVLVRDTRPALYVLEQTFQLPDETTSTRRGLIAALKLSAFDEGIVLPHERTFSGPKNDRLKLLRKTRVNLGHVFLLYPGNDVNDLVEATVRGQAPAQAQDLLEGAVLQKFWAIHDRDVIRSVARTLAPKRGLIIADGHHRYETALAFRDEARVRDAEASPDAAFTYRMVTLVSMEDPGLVILPTHRLIHGLPDIQVDLVLERSAAYFEVQGVASLGEVEAKFREVPPTVPAFGLYDGAYRVLTLRSPATLAELLPWVSPHRRELDVAVVHELFIERALSISRDAVERRENVDYMRDQAEGCAAVDRGDAQFLIVMRPTQIEQVRRCSAAGERMPQKSTDFFPKVVSGLVMMPVDGKPLDASL
jgi:uncharacterized protein (DUF1015 family)